MHGSTLVDVADEEGMSARSQMNRPGGQLAVTPAAVVDDRLPIDEN
jgi:hypothetical protein